MGLVIAVVGLLLLEIFLSWVISRYRYLFDEFPVFSPSELEKFNNYDCDLGWEPKPCEERVQGGELRPDFNGPQTKTSYTIGPDGARVVPKIYSCGSVRQDVLIEFFGDSSCMCRDVLDRFTFQSFLENEFRLGFCKNYGVGNYGSDQAVLRAERRMEGGGIAVLFVCAGAFSRVLSVYKHYSEPGNYWAVKPRFRIGKNDSLEYVPRPFRIRDQLHNLREFEEFFRSEDGFYSFFNKYMLLRRPYFWHFLRYTPPREILLKRIRSDVKNKYVKIILSVIIRVFRFIDRVCPQRKRKKAAADFVAGVQSEAGELFVQLAKRFQTVAVNRNSSPVVVITPQGKEMRDRAGYHKAIELLKVRCSSVGVELLDAGEALFPLSESDRLQCRAYHNHLSKEGNYILAGWLCKMLSPLAQRVTRDS